MKKIDTVIFDLDGTLLNTLDDLCDGVNEILKRHALPLRTLEEIRTFVGNGVRVLMQKALPSDISLDLFEEYFREFKDYYTSHCQIKTGAYKKIYEMLAFLQEKGYKMAIVSNKNHEAVLRLNDLYFKDYIKVAIGQREGIAKKPAPDTVFEAIKALGAEPDSCLYVGDSEVDAATAKNAGLSCVLVSWGFRSKEELKNELYEKMIDEPMELPIFLENLQ
ncbi:MAG TPA: HAD family hydrolase [Lachnospiraceae bacterium]